MRQKYNDGQELIFEDLNKMQARSEQTIFDRIVYEILRRKTDGFFNSSFNVLFTGATSANVSAGLGFQDVPGADESEPKKQPLYRSAAVAVAFSTPDNTDPRIDIVVVKAARADGLTASRKFKDAGTGLITTPTLTITDDDEAIVQVETGTPAPSPVAPAVPAGFIKIAECLISATTGMSGQAAITDSRTLLGLAGSPLDTGSLEYDRVTGTVGDYGVTDADLAAALGNAKAGDRILVTKSETLTAIPDVVVDNVEIVFKRGVTFTKGSVATGLKISANDCLVRNGRFLDFDTAGDEGIQVAAGSNRTFIERTRFNNCDTNIDDQGTDTTTDKITVE